MEAWSSHGLPVSLGIGDRFRVDYLGAPQTWEQKVSWALMAGAGFGGCAVRPRKQDKVETFKKLLATMKEVVGQRTYLRSCTATRVIKRGIG